MQHHKASTHHVPSSDSMLSCAMLYKPDCSIHERCFPRVHHNVHGACCKQVSTAVQPSLGRSKVQMFLCYPPTLTPINGAHKPTHACMQTHTSSQLLLQQQRMLRYLLSYSWCSNGQVKVKTKHDSAVKMQPQNSMWVCYVQVKQYA